MRTTLTPEPTVAMKLKKKRMGEQGRHSKTSNQTLRVGLDTRNPSGRNRLRFKPGIDQNKLKQLLDDLMIVSAYRRILENTMFSAQYQTRLASTGVEFARFTRHRCFNLLRSP